MRRLVFFPAALLIASCGSPSTPSDPVTVLTGSYELTCLADWIPSRPPATRAVFDFWLFSGEFDGQQQIRKAGGTIDYEFHVPIIRADMDVDAAKALWVSGGVHGVFSVSDPSAHTVTVLVDYDHAVTPADVAALAGLGARVKTFPLPGPFLAATLADEQLPAVLKLPGVTDFENNDFGCLDAAGRSIR